MEITKNKCPDIPKRIDGINELANNFWWSWNNDARLLFKILSLTGWKLSGHNPVKMLCDIDKNIFEKASKDQKFLKQFDTVITKFKDNMKKENSWFLKNLNNPGDLSITFFFSRIRTSSLITILCRWIGFFSRGYIERMKLD